MDIFVLVLTELFVYFLLQHSTYQVFKGLQFVLLDFLSKDRKNHIALYVTKFQNRLLYKNHFFSLNSMRHGGRGPSPPSPLGVTVALLISCFCPQKCLKPTLIYCTFM